MFKLVASLLGIPGIFAPAAEGAQSQLDASERLGDLLFLAIDHGIDSIRAGGALIPFVISDENGTRKIERFVVEPYEEAVTQARRAPPKFSRRVEMYVLAYDGFITVDAQKFDAILVQGAERGSGEAYLLAQRYKLAKEGRSLELIGNPALIGRENALFGGAP